MELIAVLLLLFLTTIIATSQASQVEKPLPIHPLRSAYGSGHDHHLHGISCASWRLGVEAYNLRNWKTVPSSCEAYVGHYMLGHLYRQDSKVVVDAAALYAEGLNLTKDGKDVWVFDIDETALSNLPYFAKHGFGINFEFLKAKLNTGLLFWVNLMWSQTFRVEPDNGTLSNEWVDTGKAPALPESLRLYKKLLSLGFKIVFLTGRQEVKRKITATNLKEAGYHTWEKLILRSPEDTGTAVAYKSSRRKELEAHGYRIVGNIGDQWSDIVGSNVGQRTFKLPDPMYYVS